MNNDKENENLESINYPESVDKKEIKNTENIKSDSITDKVRMKKKLITIMSGLILLFAFILLIAVSPTTVDIPYQRLETYQRDYTENEPYSVQVPYTDTEYYTEKEPYTYLEDTPVLTPYDTKEPFDSSVISVKMDNKHILIPTWDTQPASQTNFYFEIENKEQQGGTFTISVIMTPPDSTYVNNAIEFAINVAGLYAGVPGVGTSIKGLIPKSDEIKFNKSGYIPALSLGQIPISIGKAGYTIKQGNYELIAPTKTVTKYTTTISKLQNTSYRDVQKQREVTKYRTETQYRNVIKQRTTERSVSDTKQEIVQLWQKVFGAY